MARNRDTDDALADVQAELADAVRLLDVHHEVVAETRDVIVYADHDGYELMEVLDDCNVTDERLRDGVRREMHDAAAGLTDYDWSAADPLVVPKPEGMETGQCHVEEIVNSLCERGLSPGQAWAYYGVVNRDHSRNEWAKRMGYSDHSAVSEAVRKAQSKLP